MQLETRLTRERIDRMVAAGFWGEATLLDHLDAAVRAAPDKIALTGWNTERGEQTSHSYRQVDRLSRRIAAGLIDMGVERGDVVSMQLPNWPEFVLVHLACLRCGAITNPLMPILRHRELEFMLNLAESRVVFVPQRFRGFDFPTMIGELRPQLPMLRDVVVVGGAGEASLERRLLAVRREDEMAAAEFERRRPSADDVIEILYTSGTTGEPKGVMHTSNTLLSGLASYCGLLGLRSDDVVLAASPLAHQTGFIYGMMTSIVLGSKCVLLDIWDAGAAARLVQDEQVTFTMASTPFLSDLTEIAAAGRYDMRSFRVFLSAGAPIPRHLVQTASRRLGAHVLSGWGMTENGSVTVTAVGDPEDKIVQTDGRALASMQVRVVDDRSRPLPPDREGRLQVRGAGNFVGYLKRPQYYEVDEEGWFETGDIARMDVDGYIRIVGRSKDIVIRGGENIPVVEVEELLSRHPSVREVAVVGVPDARLGERACAVVGLRPGCSLTFDEMVAFLLAERLTRQYLPERLLIVEELPRTPSGKVQKFRVRVLASDGSADATGG